MSCQCVECIGYQKEPTDAEIIAALESALAKSASREAALVEKLKVAEEALLLGARSAEALKRPCGMDPETPQALRNGEYMSISWNLRAALAKIKEAS